MTLTLFNKPIKEDKKYRRIQGELFEENRSTFLIDGKWRRIIAPGIFINQYNKVTKFQGNEPLINVLIGKNRSGNLIFAKMDERCYNKIYAMINNNGNIEYHVAWPDLAIENLSLKFNNKYNFYYEDSISEEVMIRHSSSFKYDSPFIYNSYELIDSFKKTKENVYRYPNEKKISLNPLLADYLKDVTFGIEFETSKMSFLPVSVLMKYGVIPLRDGSIKGYEFTTIPLKEGEGLNDLFFICKYLKENCSYDKSCSVHIHMTIDGMPKKDVSFIKRLLTLGFQIQDEIYSIVPEYKYFDSKGEKNKNYTKPIPVLSMKCVFVQELEDEETKEISAEQKNIDQVSVAEFLVGTNDDSILMKGKHPCDMDKSHKWDIKERYFWLNTIPYFFNNGTIENRMMEATFDFETILSWIVLTASIIKFAMDEKNENVIAEMFDVAQYSKNEEVIRCLSNLLKK